MNVTVLNRATSTFSITFETFVPQKLWILQGFTILRSTYIFYLKGVML